MTPHQLRKALKQATARATDRHGSGGREKSEGRKPKAVTLPSLETARKITEGRDKK